MSLNWQKNQLCLRDAPLTQLAKKHGTPVYIYDLKYIAEQLAAYIRAFKGKAEIYYAMKANSHPKILETIRDGGGGVDVVSGGEIREALKAGIEPSKIIFAGVGKTREEIELALTHKVGQINVESVQELQRIASLATERNPARVAFRINPDVQPNTHPYIATGLRENKFGMSEDELPHLQKVLREHPKTVTLQGLTIHIGSQILDTQVFFEAIQKTILIYRQLPELSTFDIGGGLGIAYTDTQTPPDLDAFGAQVCKLLAPLQCRIFVEPGRSLVGPAGVLLTEVQYVKETSFKRFVIVDTGMHHILRPALYSANHRITPIVQEPGRETVTCDIVGPICESADVLGKSRLLPALRQGDILAIWDVGAYGAVMSSRYNGHGPPKEVAF